MCLQRLLDLLEQERDLLEQEREPVEALLELLHLLHQLVREQRVCPMRQPVAERAHGDVGDLAAASHSAATDLEPEYDGGAVVQCRHRAAVVWLGVGHDVAVAHHSWQHLHRLKQVVQLHPAWVQRLC